MNCYGAADGMVVQKTINAGPMTVLGQPHNPDMEGNAQSLPYSTYIGVID